MHTYSILIDLSEKEGKVKNDASVIELMIKRGQYPNVVTYNLLMRGHCLYGEIDEALVMLKIMKGKDLFLDSSTYNILINGCYIKI